MTDRYVQRQTYKNLLGGGGGVNVQPSLKSVDENVHAMMSKSVSLKAAAAAAPASVAAAAAAAAAVSTVSSTLASSVSSTLSMHHHQSTNGSCSVANSTSAQLLGQMANAFATNAMLRNALGDIGNRIAMAPPSAAGVAGKHASIVEHNKQPTTTTTTTSSEEVSKMSSVSTAASLSNNTCIMEEEVDMTSDETSSDDTGEVIDEEDADDDECEEVDDGEAEASNCVDESIVDIDEFDGDNPQLASNYVKDIYAYLSQVEKRHRIAATFLQRKIVTAKMRSVLVDWLIQVHLKFHLLQETLYLCVHIIDAYLMLTDVPKMQLQLVGVTAMFVASKYEEMYVPAIEDFVYMTDNTYTKAEIRAMEISILKTLNFLFCKPLPLHFLRRFSKAGNADAKQHTLAKYFMELSLHDAEFSSLDPSFLAASALCLSFKLLNGTGWTRTLEHYSSYKQASLYPGMQKIAKLVLRAMEPDYKYKAVISKYGTSKQMRISLIPELQGELIREFANDEMQIN